MGYRVRALDDLSTGKQKNVDMLADNSHYEFVKGDIKDLDVCMKACEGVDYVLNQAAWGSVPRSLEMPLFYSLNNIQGTLNMPVRKVLRSLFTLQVQAFMAMNLICQRKKELRVICFHLMRLLNAPMKSGQSNIPCITVSTPTVCVTSMYSVVDRIPMVHMPLLFPSSLSCF